MSPDAPTHQKTSWRIPLKLVAVLGLGVLVAVALGTVLYLGFSVAMNNTVDLLGEKVEITLDRISARVDRHLQPVERQAIEIVRAFESGALSLDNPAQLESYFAGVMSASPQVSAMGIAKPDKTVTAIIRQDFKMSEGPWPQAKGFEKLFQQQGSGDGPQWRNPVWSDRLHQFITTLLAPLHYKGQFLGVLIQTVPISELSQYLSEQTYSDGVPFISYDTDKLIAHPTLINWQPLISEDRFAIPTIQTVGDSVLEKLLSTPGREPKIFTELKFSQGKIVTVGEREYVLFSRQITRYGPKQWTMGIYLDTRTAGDVLKRLMQALAVGAGFLILFVGLAIFAGSRLNRSIQSIAGAMLQVRDGGVADVEKLPGSRITELDDAAQSFNQMIHGLRERDLIRKTLGRYVPEKIAESLLKENGVLETEEAVATVLFADIEGFTNLTESLGPEGIVELLNAYFSDMVDIIERHGGVVTQFQGDAILATFNVPIKNDHHAANALKAALEMQDCYLSRQFARHALRARIGVNTGPLVAGAVGAKGRLNYTVHGDAVNLAARIESLNKDYGTYILTTQSTIDEAGEVAVTYVGETTVRGQSTPVNLYTLGATINP